MIDLVDITIKVGLHSFGLLMIILWASWFFHDS